MNQMTRRRWCASSRARLLLLSCLRQIRHQLGVVFCAGGDLDEGHADLGGEELFGVGAGVGLGSFAVLDDEVHLLDAFAPDGVVFFQNVVMAMSCSCTPASL